MALPPLITSLLDTRRLHLYWVLVRLNGDDVDALSFFALRDRASEVSRRYLERLQNLIPAQLFDIAIQAVVGGKVVAKVRIKPLRRDVVAQKILSHGHSGDPSRKAKLLERQKEGKRRLREISKVQVPPEAFVAMVKM
ncbi:Elongation factor 4 (EF-4) (Ribosomal back-translocase LepA) [Durusdinium trenchii]|uniref:Elongation factor 4 (EF-4) (Ribosomal back-translocase LepA) n=1 Tax=Durusdinium trenchii TaxID=1381693 RepID=A0ABP0RSZ4_9DINO